MKRIYITELNMSMCQCIHKQTNKYFQGSFRYYTALDDFGNRLKDLPWDTSKDQLKALGERVRKVCIDKRPLEIDEDIPF